MKARKAEIEKVTAADLDIPEEELGLMGSPTRVMKVFAPERRAGGEKWEGEADELAKRLVGELGKRQLV